MSALFTCAIDFKPSIVYRRSLFLLYGFTIWMVLQAAFPLVLKLVLTIWLIAQCCKAYRIASPCTPYQRLIYFMDEWVLIDAKQIRHDFDQHRILLDAGLFFILELSRPQEKRRLMIFHDQLPFEKYRRLRLLQKLRRKKWQK